LHLHYLCNVKTNMDSTQQIRDKGLKATPARLSVIKALGINNLAYAHAELEQMFSDMDRVTLYRVLNDFEEAGLVHKIVDAAGITRFALCKHSCPDKHHADEHVHFNCHGCHKMFCLENVHAPQIKMPAGFKATGLQTLIYGLCESCNAA
jgi:Fur family ferric uptake transcriptional regulator